MSDGSLQELGASRMISSHTRLAKQQVHNNVSLIEADVFYFSSCTSLLGISKRVARVGWPNESHESPSHTEGPCIIRYPSVSVLQLYVILSPVF